MRSRFRASQPRHGTHLQAVELKTVWPWLAVACTVQSSRGTAETVFHYFASVLQQIDFELTYNKVKIQTLILFVHVQVGWPVLEHKKVSEL